LQKCGRGSFGWLVGVREGVATFGTNFRSVYIYARRMLNRNILALTVPEIDIGSDRLGYWSRSRIYILYMVSHASFYLSTNLVYPFTLLLTGITTFIWWISLIPVIRIQHSSNVTGRDHSINMSNWSCPSAHPFALPLPDYYHYYLTGIKINQIIFYRFYCFWALMWACANLFWRIDSN